VSSLDLYPPDARQAFEEADAQFRESWGSATRQGTVVDTDDLGQMVAAQLVAAAVHLAGIEIASEIAVASRRVVEALDVVALRVGDRR
jgi:hypothetical protein